MQFLYHRQAGAPRIELSGEGFVHVVSARRTRAGESLALRNLRDCMLHSYIIESVGKKNALLHLESSIDLPIIPHKKSHLIWAITQSKTIEKALPSLNELGLTKLSLFWADFSQRGQKLSLERLEKILISSCEQCGRSNLCEIEILESTQAALECYPSAKVLDFGGKVIGGDLSESVKLDSGVLVGAEGGFSQRERALFAGREILRYATPQILRSQTAALALLAKAL